VTSVPTLPLLAPWYRVVGDDERLLLEYAQSLVVLEGAAVRSLLPALLPLLDGTRDADAIAARLGPAARPAVDAALELLTAHGIVVEGPDAPHELRDPARAAAASFALPPAEAADRLRRAAVGLAGSAGSVVEIARLLSVAGIRTLRRLGWRGRGAVDLVVVAPAAGELDRLGSWNERALARGTPYLPVRPWDGRVAAVGPLILPHQTCCYRCVLLRRGANLGYGVELVDVEEVPLAAAPDLPLTAIAAALAAHLAVRWVVGRDATVPGVMHTVSAQPSPSVEAHPVLRVPRCPSCSAAEQQAPPLPWHAAAA